MSDYLRQSIPSTMLTDTYEAESVFEVRGHDNDVGFNPQLNARSGSMSDFFKQGVPSSMLTDTCEAASVSEVKGYDDDMAFNPQLNVSSSAEALCTTHLVKTPEQNTPLDRALDTMETRSGDPTPGGQDIE